MAVQTVLFLAANHYGTLLTYPVVDEWEYLQTARHFVFWNFDLGDILWHPPLYAAFLAVAIKWTGVAELLWLKSLNIALFAGTIPLMHALLLHLWPERIIRARILTALWAFYPLNLLFNLTLLGTALYSLLTIWSSEPNLNSRNTQRVNLNDKNPQALANLAFLTSEQKVDISLRTQNKSIASLLELLTPVDGRAAVDVQPEAGTLVLFRSADLPHEVLPARRERWSVAGWFRRD